MNFQVMLIFSTVYSKIRAFIILVGIIFLILSFALDYHKPRPENQIVSTAETHFKHEITSLLDLNSESIMKTLIDNVYWDDLVINVEKNDTGWFTPNMTLVATAFFDYYSVSNSRFVMVRQKAGVRAMAVYTYFCRPIFHLNGKFLNSLLWSCGSCG